MVARKFLEHLPRFWHIDCDDLPNDAYAHASIVVGHDVAHPAHFAEWEFWHGLTGLLAQMGCGFAADLDPPNDGALFLRVLPKLSFRHAVDICPNEPRGLEDVAQASE